MSEAARPNPLPRVEKTDLHLVAIDELLDPSHAKRWKQFAEENPEFAREILLEAQRLNKKGETSEQIAINIATFTAQALKNALERISNGDVDEGSLPLDE